MLIKPSLYDDLIILPDVESLDEAPMSVEIFSHDDPDEAPMLVEMRFPDRPVPPPPPPPVEHPNEAPKLVEMWSQNGPNEAPTYLDIRYLDELVPPLPLPPPNEAPMLEEIWLHDEPVPSSPVEPPEAPVLVEIWLNNGPNEAPMLVDSLYCDGLLAPPVLPPVDPTDEKPVVTLHDVPVYPPHVEPPNEAQDFDAIVSALASHHLGDVQRTVSWWLMNHGTEQPRNRLTGHFYDVVESEDIDILDYLLDMEVPFTLLQIEIAIRKKSIPMLDMFLRHGWDINEPGSWTTPPLLRYSERIQDICNSLTIAYLGSRFRTRI